MLFVFRGVDVGDHVGRGLGVLREEEDELRVRNEECVVEELDVPDFV